MIKKSCFIFILSIFINIASFSKDITSNISDVLLIGRFNTSTDKSIKFSWSASTIKSNFQGSSIKVNLKSNGDNWFNVIIDDEVKDPINVKSNSKSIITLASNLSSGNHSVELIKRTDCWVGDVEFGGFIVENGSFLAPPSVSSHKIEFIGDSITCGYGNEGTDPNKHFTPANENAYLAYSLLTSRALKADQITIAGSGKGIVHNYGGDTNQLMTELYKRIMPSWPRVRISEIFPGISF